MGRATLPCARGDEDGSAAASPAVAADAYLIVAACQRLYAPSIDELAEIAECAIRAGDQIERLRARTPAGWRPLRDDEFARFVGLLAARLD